MKSAKISEIDTDNDEYLDKIFITVDIDWANDDLIEIALDMLEEQRVKCTFFVTHETSTLNRIRRNSNFELGIHPNLNPLLHEASNRTKLARERFEELLEIVPEAQSYRCHSMVTSSRVLEIASEFGLKYDCNYFIPYQAGIELKPWKIWNEIIRVPYFWEDDISLEYGIEESPTELKNILERPGLRVFDFHPVHIALNTEHLNRYKNLKDSQQYPGVVFNAAFAGYGTRNKFEFILENSH